MSRPGALIEDEAKQSWIVPPDPSITGAVDSSSSTSSGGVGSSSTSSSSSSGPSAATNFQRRRQHAVAAFLRQGESNENFKMKAPSILTTYYNVAQAQQPLLQSSSDATSSSSSSSGSQQQPAASPESKESGAASSSSSSSSSARPSGLRRLIANVTRRLRPKRRKARRKAANGAKDAANGNGNNGDDGMSSDSSSEDEEDTHGLDTSEDEEEAEQSNFATVDWGRQDESDMLEFHRLHEPLPAAKLLPGGRGVCGVVASKIGGAFRVIWRGLQQAWRAGQGWVLCGLVGLFTGLLASMIDMCVHWVIDIRVGVCKDNIWLSNKSCCAAIVDNSSPVKDNSNLQEVCPLWQSWDVILKNFGLPISPMQDYWFGYLVYVLISGVLGLTSAWLVRTWSRYAAGSGIPEIKTILGGVVIRRVLGAWTLLTKCVALVLSVSSGLNVGKEGPFVHIAACVSHCLCSLFARYRHNQAKSNEILSAACAAGVAVAFGAPIGGILYSLEEVSSFFPHKTMWRAFFCAIIASISVQYIDPFQEGKLVQFQISYTNPWQWFEMVPFVFVGVMGGLMGAFFIHCNLYIQKGRKGSFMARIPLVESCIVAMMSSAIKYQSSFTRGNTTNLLEALFSDCSEAPGIDPLDMCNLDFVSNTAMSLAFTTVVSLLLTTYSIGIPVPAGLLIPSLTIGAAMGRLVGTGVRWMQISNPTWGVWSGCQVGDINCITPGIYALVGGAAVLGGVTRMTIALVVIMFEITGGLTYLLPIMIAVITSKVVGDSFGTDSIYEGSIEYMKYPFLDVKKEIPHELKVKHAMTAGSELLVLSIHGHTVGSLQQRLHTMHQLNINGFPVVTTDEERLVVGYITRSELKAGLKHALRFGGSGGSGPVSATTPCYFAMLDLRYPRTGPYVDLSALLDPAPVQVNEGMALYRLHDMFSKLGLRYCLVARFGKVVGLCTKKDIITRLHQYEHQQHAMATKGDHHH